MEQGAELFAREGVANTRTSDIAAAAGVAVGTLYLHFKDKQGLLRAILFEGVEALLQEVRDLAQAPPDGPWEATRRHTEIMVRFAEEHPGLCRVMFDPESVRCGVSREINQYLVTMQEMRLREGPDRTLVTPGLEISIAAHALVGMFFQVLDWWTRNPGEVSRDVVIDTLSRLRYSGLYQREAPASGWAGRVSGNATGRAL